MMLILAVDGVFLEIFKRIVHPTHIPFKIETETSFRSGFGNSWKRGRLLGNHQCARVVFMNDFVRLTEEIDRFKVFASAVLIRYPFPIFAGVIEVKHRGYGIYTEAIDVIAFAPGKCTSDKETSDFVTTVVKNQSAPVLVKTLTWISVLVESRTVKFRKCKTISRKVSRHPVHNHADSVLVKRIDKEHKVLRRPETISRREEPRHLITPRTIEGMLG